MVTTPLSGSKQPSDQSQKMHPIIAHKPQLVSSQNSSPATANLKNGAGITIEKLPGIFKYFPCEFWAKSSCFKHWNIFPRLRSIYIKIFGAFYRGKRGPRSVVELQWSPVGRRWSSDGLVDTNSMPISSHWWGEHEYKLNSPWVPTNRFDFQSECPDREDAAGVRQNANVNSCSIQAIPTEILFWSMRIYTSKFHINPTWELIALIAYKTQLSHSWSEMVIQLITWFQTNWRRLMLLWTLFLTTPFNPKISRLPRQLNTKNQVFLHAK